MSQTALPLSTLASLLFTLMGPVAAIPLFAGATAGAERGLQVKIALMAYAVALIGLAVAVFIGAGALAGWGVSPPSLIIAAGVILALTALRSIFGAAHAPSGNTPAPTVATGFAPIAIGLALTLFHLVSIPVSNASLNLSRRDADVAVRATSEPPDTLVGRKVGPMAWGVYGKTGSEFSRCDPLGPEALYIGFGPPMEEIEAAVWIDRNVPAARVVARVNTMHIAALAAAGGLGLAVLPRVVGDSMPELTRVSDKPPTTNALWLLTHADLKGAARVRAFMDYAWTYLSKERSRLAGE